MGDFSAVRSGGLGAGAQAAGWGVLGEVIFHAATFDFPLLAALHCACTPARDDPANRASSTRAVAAVGRPLPAWIRAMLPRTHAGRGVYICMYVGDLN